MHFGSIAVRSTHRSQKRWPPQRRLGRFVLLMRLSRAPLCLPLRQRSFFGWGADTADLERIRSLLLCMGNKIVHAGGHGAGTSMKMVINLLLGNAMAAFAEGIALGEGLGISRKMLFDSLLGTPAVAPFLASKREKIESRNYEAEFPLRWMQKDMHLASVSAYESGAAMPLTNAAKELYRLAMREGHANQDFSAIYDYLTNNYDCATIEAGFLGHLRLPK